MQSLGSVHNLSLGDGRRATLWEANHCLGIFKDDPGVAILLYVKTPNSLQRGRGVVLGGGSGKSDHEFRCLGNIEIYERPLRLRFDV